MLTEPVPQRDQGRGFGRAEVFAVGHVAACRYSSRTARSGLGPARVARRFVRPRHVKLACQSNDATRSLRVCKECTGLQGIREGRAAAAEAPAGLGEAPLLAPLARAAQLAGCLFVALMRQLWAVRGYWGETTRGAV